MQMTATLLDAGILVLIVLSFIIGLVRGLVREAISLATWIAAFAFVIYYFKPLAEVLPFNLQSEVARLGLSAAIIFFGVLVIGSIVNFLLTSAVSSIGLGGVDYFLGGIFGLIRAFLIVTLLVILADLTPYPSQSWWKESRLMPWFEQGAASLKAQIPADVSGYLGREPL